MPLGLEREHGRGTVGQLVGGASLITLEQMYTQAGVGELAFTDERVMQAPWAPVTERWVGRAASAIAFAINTSATLLNLDGVIVDGTISQALLERLLHETRMAMAR